MSSRWAKLAEDAIVKASVMQSRAIAEIYQGSGPAEPALSFEDYADELDAAGHVYGGECFCAVCERQRPMLAQMAQQMLMQGQANGGT